MTTYKGATAMIVMRINPSCLHCTLNNFIHELVLKSDGPFFNATPQDVAEAILVVLADLTASATVSAEIQGLKPEDIKTLPDEIEAATKRAMDKIRDSSHPIMKNKEELLRKYYEENPPTLNS